MRSIRIKLDAKGQPIGYLAADGRIVGDDEICLAMALESLGIFPGSACQMVKDLAYLGDLRKYSRQGE